MKRIFVALMMVWTLLALGGCGGGDGGDGRTVITTEILSEAAVDGFIRELFPSLTLQINQDVPSIFVGVNTVTLDESRGFLHFPLGDIPLDHSIDAATLDLFVRDVVSPSGSVPIRLELVSLPTATLFTGDEFDDPPLTNIVVVFPIFTADINRHVIVDVTPLMRQAQALGVDFQVRLLQDVTGARGVVEIDDTAAATAPLLTVDHF